MGYSTDDKGYRYLDLSINYLIVSRYVVFDEDSFPLAASPSLTDLDFFCELGPMISTIGTHLTIVGTSPLVPRQPAPEISPGFEPPVANLPAPAVPPGFLPQVATTAVSPPITISPPPRTWPASPVTYVRREVGVEAAGTRGAPGATLSREVGTGAAETCDAPGAALRQEVGAGDVDTCGAPGAALRREVGAGAAGTRGFSGAALSRVEGINATGTRGTPEVALSPEVGAGAVVTRGGPEAALSREVGARATVTRGSPGATLSREAGTTPPPPLLRPSTHGQGVVVPITPPDNPHQMITWGKSASRWCLIVLSSPLQCNTPYL
jgi:hypothetical protein